MINEIDCAGPGKNSYLLIYLEHKNSDRLLGLVIRILQFHTVTLMVVAGLSNDRRMITMFQNTSSNLPAIHQPTESLSSPGDQQAATACPEEPPGPGQQETLLPGGAGGQGRHRAGLLQEQACGQPVSGTEPSHQVSHSSVRVSLPLTSHHQVHLHHRH